MAALRSPRLNQVFGAELADLTTANVEALVTGGVTEAFDLDFKVALYSGNDKGKRDLCGDVAALANGAGGVIVIGVGEDDQARACAAPGVALSDDENRRIRQVVAAGVSPLPRFDIVTVQGSAPEHGFVLIAVPPSPNAPHGVSVNDGWRYPRRHDTTTVYLSEAQVAAAYADRAAGQRARAERAAGLQESLVATMNAAEMPYVVLTLIPDTPGSFTLDTRSFREFRNQVIGKRPRIMRTDVDWTRTRVRAGHLAADASDDRIGPEGQWLGCELAADGAGTFAAQVGFCDDSGTRVSEEYLAEGIISGLRFLAGHARDRASTGGSATIRAAIWPVSSQSPARLGHDRGFKNQYGPAVSTAPTAESLANLDDLAADGPELVVAAHALMTGIVHGFGQPEALQLTPDGQLRSRYWGGTHLQAITPWANSAGVQLTEETVG
ncbi:AlbA family DNA-binding domain-containing protein [Streptodolium elevatio]